MSKKTKFSNTAYLLLSLSFLSAIIYDVRIVSIEQISEYFGFIPYIPYLFIFTIIVSLFASQKIIDLYEKSAMSYWEDLILIFPSIIITLISYSLLFSFHIISFEIASDKMVYLFMFWFFVYKLGISAKIHRREDLSDK
jgi:hypothetical protein